MKTLKKKKISSFIADKFDTSLLFFKSVPTVLSACPSALHQHLDYSRRKSDATRTEQLTASLNTTLTSRYITDKSSIYLQEEWPLGKLLRPSLTTDSSPVHFSSGFTSPSGKHRQKKSGLGRPVTVTVNYTGPAAQDY